MNTHQKWRKHPGIAPKLASTAKTVVNRYEVETARLSSWEAQTIVVFDCPGPATATVDHRELLWQRQKEGTRNMLNENIINIVIFNVIVSAGKASLFM